MRTSRRLGAGRFWLAAVAAGALLGVAAAPARAKTIELGALLPLTGPGAVIGTEQMRGIQFAVDELNAKGGIDGDTVHVIYDDDQAKSDQAVLDFNKLVSLQHVPMIWLAYSGPTLATAPLATRRHILILNSGAQSDALQKASPYLVNTLPSTEEEVKVMVKYLRAHGKSTAAVLYENDAAGIGGRDDFVKDFKAAGGKIVAQEPVQFGQTDFRPALLKLASAKPQVLYVVTTVGMVPLADQLHEMNHKWLVAGTTFMNNPQVIADPNAAGLIHTQVEANVSPALMAAFQKKMGVEMGFFSRQYYNSAQMVFIILDHMIKAKMPITGANMRTELFKIKTFATPVPMTFTSNTAIVPIAIEEMKGGTEVTITHSVAK
ncbi:MAG TPA: ABC transporter substrate-binding protein [Acetobacteraceae bacterium]|nr:ABC transporter substrate-binding protein [Acetobacteraceae bacterium]